MRATTQLHDQLMDMFEPAEFYSLVTRIYPQVAGKIPRADETSQARLVYETVEELRRHGLLDDTFFAVLQRERPARAAELRAIRQSMAASTPRVVILHTPADRRYFLEALEQAELLAVSKQYQFWHRGLPSPLEPLAEAAIQVIADAWAIVVLASPRLYLRDELRTALPHVAARRDAAGIVPTTAGSYQEGGMGCCALVDVSPLDKLEKSARASFWVEFWRRVLAPRGDA